MNTNYQIDRYVLDTLMRDLVGHDRRPASFIVYLSVAAACEAGSAALSHRELAERTGLSKRGVQEAVAHLEGRRLIEIRRDGRTATPRYRLLSPRGR